MSEREGTVTMQSEEQVGGQGERTDLKDATLLPLKMKEGPQSRKQVASRS